jgi:hypothetical protein
MGMVSSGALNACNKETTEIHMYHIIVVRCYNVQESTLLATYLALEDHQEGSTDKNGKKEKT